MTVNEFMQEWNNPSEKMLVHTSGSTGIPKPLWVEKKCMEASARITCDFLGLHEGDTALLCMSLDYIAGKMMLVRSLVRGLRLLSVPPSGHPLASFVTEKQNGESIEVDFAAMVPLQVYNTLQVPEERERLMQIRHLIIGGGSIDDELAAELKTFPHAVWSTYGMTETLSHIALRRLNGDMASQWYTPFPSVAVSLSDDGCLMIDAPRVCRELLITNDRGEIQDVVTAAGVFRQFRILGRKDNVITSGGVKIQIEEVERILKPHVEVPFLITKRPDKKFGEAVVMLVQSDVITDIPAICEQFLPKYWQPRQYIPVIEIPLTGTGKPARMEAEKIARSFSFV